MKLPSNAIIATEKIKDYLLSERKRNDKSKWLAKAGYKLSNWQILETDLRNQILSLDVNVRTVWIMEHKSKTVKFITMFPDRK